MTPMTKILLPKDYNKDAFYYKHHSDIYRIYKVEHFFSSVGGAYVILLYASKSNLQKFQKKFDADYLSLPIESPTLYNKLIDKLKHKGILEFRDVL